MCKLKLAISTVLLCAIASPVFADQRLKSSTGVKRVQKIFEKYWSSKSVFMKVKKKSIMGFLQKTAEHEGRLLFSKGLLRIDFAKPEEITFIFGTKKIILVKKIKQGLEEKTLVTYMNKKRVSSHSSLMSLLFGEKKVWSKLKLTAEVSKKNLMSLHFTPVDEKSMPGVIKLAIVFDTNTEQIKAIKQWDSTENEIQFMFSSILFDVPVPKNAFRYIPPKNAEVSHL